MAAGDGGGNRIGSGCWPTRSANSTTTLTHYAVLLKRITDAAFKEGEHAA